MIPIELKSIVSFLKKNKLDLKEFTSDGRVNSALMEEQIKNFLQKNNFNIQLSSDRDWKDFSLVGSSNNKLIPVNIKVSAMHTADNLNCKLGIYYALTGLIPSFSNGISWESFFELLKTNINENELDYFFLIINKNNTQDVFATSLKSLKNLVPNGNNLPFQACWNNNREIVCRNFNEAKEFLLLHLGKSLKLRSIAFSQFLNFFPEYESKV